MADPCTVLIAEDQVLLRESLSRIISYQDDLTVVAEVATGSSAVAQTRLLKPQLVLMDIRMPQLNGIEATRAIRTDPLIAATPILVLTMLEEDQYAQAALQAGANGFLLKDTPPEQLLAAIRGTARGEQHYGTPVLTQMRRAYLAQTAPNPDLATSGLTAREIEILAVVAQGLNNQEIAAHFTISVATVKTHIGKLLGKLAARDRAGLVIAAYRLGLGNQ